MILASINAPRDPRGLAAFRILFGALMVFAVIRFWVNGWIDELYVAPATHFTYLGFEWVRPWPSWGMYAHFAVMALAAVFVMVGAWTRVSAAVFFVAFTYAELIEKAAYLNHYYLVSLLALLLVFVPAGTTWSVDAWRRGDQRNTSVGRWAYDLLRVQVGLVYVFAGFAKLNSDWLFRAEPLRSWLQNYGELPLMGEPWFAYGVSWAGALFDLTIVAWLSWSRSRAWAYGACVFFHVVIWLLFPVGVFSWVMLVAATVFFSPSWPARWIKTPLSTQAPVRSPTVTRAWVAVAALYIAIQVLVPLRFALYPGHTNWTEEGFRFSWRVMLVEKTGMVEYEVQTETGGRFVVYPRKELTPLQYQMMCTQPDMIHEYALNLAERFEQRGHGRVRVYAHTWAALNGHPSQRLIDPRVDLASKPRSLRAADWIAPFHPCSGSAPTLSNRNVQFCSFKQ